MIFGVDNISSSHIGNCKNYFLVLGKGPTDEINDSVDAAEKKSRINFIKPKTKFCSSLHYNGDMSVGEKSISLKSIIKM